MTFPVHFGDPFFLPDSAREPIEYPLNSGQWYNYIAYAKTADGTLLPIEYDVPGKPIFPAVIDDEDIVVYFTNQLAVTVRYVEYGSPANVLKNNDYFLVQPGGSFSVTPGMMGPITSVGKRYVYEGWSYPSNIDSPTPGAPPDPAFLNMQENKEIILHFSTVYLITLKYHENLPYADGVDYDELLPVVTLTIKAGQSFSLDGPAIIHYDGYTYNYISKFKWDTDARPANAGPPYIEAVYGDYTIIYLYEKDEPQTDHSVVVMYREFGNTANVLKADYHEAVAHLGDFYLGAPPAIPGYTYYAYQIDRNPTQLGNPPADPLFEGVDTDYVVILQYIPNGSMLERFRELGNEGNILIPDQLIELTGGAPYVPRGWVPPPVITVDAYHVYTYQGYRLDGGPLVTTPVPASFTVGAGQQLEQRITYLYSYEVSKNMGGAIFAKADAAANETDPGWDGNFADPAALEELAVRLAGAKFSVYPDVSGHPGLSPLRWEGAGAGSYLLNTMGGVTEITTDGSGMFMLYGFPAAGITYWIVETQPPEDYLPEEGRYAFAVTANGTAPGCHALFDERAPEPLPYALGAEKGAEGKNLSAGQFRFGLWLSNEEGDALELLDTAANASAGMSSPVEFEPVTYDRAGVHYYLIKEPAPAKAQQYWSADETVYLVKLVLENNAGTLIPAVTYTVLGEDTWEDYEDGANPPAFLNTYDPPTSDIALDKLAGGQPVLAWLAGRGLTGSACDAVLDGMAFSLYRAPEGGGELEPGGLVVSGVKLDANGRIAFQGVTPGWYAVAETLTGVAAQLFAQAGPLYIYVGPGGVMSTADPANIDGEYKIHHTPGYELDVKLIYDDGCEVYGNKPDGSNQRFCSEKFEAQLLPDGPYYYSLCADLGAHWVNGDYVFDEHNHGFSDADTLALIAALDCINDEEGLETKEGRALAQIIVWNMILRVHGDAGFAEDWPHSGSAEHAPGAKAVKIEGYGSWYTPAFAQLIDDILDDPGKYIDRYLGKEPAQLEEEHVTGVMFLLGDGSLPPDHQQRQIVVQFGEGTSFENDPLPTAQVVIEGEKLVEGEGAPAQDFEFELLWTDEDGVELVGPPPFVMPVQNPITVHTTGVGGSPCPVVFEAMELPPGEYYFILQETDGGMLGWTYDTQPRLIAVTVEVVAGAVVVSVSSDSAPVPPPRVQDTRAFYGQTSSGDAPQPTTGSYLLVDKANDTVDGLCAVGDTVTYTVTVTNIGESDASVVKVSDLLPPGMVYVDGSAKIDGVTADDVMYDEYDNRVHIPVGFIKGAGSFSEDCEGEAVVTFEALVTGTEIAQNLLYTNQARVYYRDRGHESEFKMDVSSLSNVDVIALRRGDLAFVNSYEPPPAPPVELLVHKDVVGMLDCEEDFYFILIEMEKDGGGGEPVYTAKQYGIYLPLTITGEGTDCFVLEGLTPGTYYFRIDEYSDYPPPGWAYDESEYIVEVEIAVVDNEFDIQVTYPGGGEGGVTFTNRYSDASFDFLFNKTDERGLPMDGAEFMLYACGDPEHLAAGDHDPLGGESCWQWLQTAVSGEAAEDLEDVPGRVLFTGLADGLYLLAEAATVPGYQLPHAQWLVRVEASAEPPVLITAFGGTPPGFMEADGELYLANYKALVLPRTGSVTTLLFSAGGAMLLSGAGVLTAGGIRSRKNRAKKEEG